METGIAVPPAVLERAAVKEHRVLAYIGARLQLGLPTR